jgi:hypothetical protein
VKNSRLSTFKILAFSISFFVATGCSKEKPSEPKPAPPIDFSERAAELWEGVHSHCEIDTKELMKLRKEYFSYNPEKKKDLDASKILELAKKREGQGYLQQAIWLYGELEDGESQEKVKELKAELKDILTNGSFEESDLQLGGTVEKKVLVFKNGTRAVFKLGDDPSVTWSNPRAEVAAYVLDQILGTEIVPMTVLRTIDGVTGSVQVFVEGAKSGQAKDIFVPNFPAIAYFDTVTRNRDRKRDNYMKLEEENRLVGIDNGDGFKLTQTCLSGSQSIRYLVDRPNLKENLMDITLDDLQGELKEWLKPEEIQSAWESIEDLQSVFKEWDCQLSFNESDFDAVKATRLKIFGQGAFCYKAPKGDFVRPVAVKRNRSETAEQFSIKYTLEDVAFAERENLIFRDTSPRKLQPGYNYNYIVTDTGVMDFARVDNTLEYGVKHNHIAQGRKVIAAGEFKLASDWSYEVNSFSGSIILPLLNLHDGYSDELNLKIENLFTEEMRWVGSLVTRPLLSGNLPSPSYLDNLCRFDLFTRNNPNFCQ